MLKRSVRRCFAYFGLAYYSQGVIAALQSASGDVARTVAGETNLSSTIVQALILAGLLAAVALQPGRYARLCRPALPLLCIAGLALCSAAWSHDPVRTLRRAAALSECLLFGFYLYCTDGLETTIRRLGRVCVVMALLSLAAYVAVPRIGRETALGYERAMRGVFPQKNTLSECMLLGLCCYAYRLLERPRWRHWAAIGLLASCIVLARGASAVVVAGVMATVALWLGLRARPVLRLGLGFVIGWFVLAAGTALLAFPMELFALAGRDASLTGRVPLWAAILPEIARAPLVGHGYAGFWSADSLAVQAIWAKVGWPAPDGHSSLLDILLQLGAIGLALYGWAAWRLAALAGDAARAGLPAARFVALFGTTLLLIGLDEGPIPIPNAWTVLVTLSTLTLARHRALRRPRAVVVVAERDTALQQARGSWHDRPARTGTAP